MFAVRFLEEGGAEASIGWLVWVALAVFFLMVFLGWLAVSKGWLADEEKPINDAHAHDGHAK